MRGQPQAFDFMRAPGRLKLPRCPRRSCRSRKVKCLDLRSTAEWLYAITECEACRWVFIHRRQEIRTGRWQPAPEIPSP